MSTAPKEPTIGETMDSGIAYVQENATATGEYVNDKAAEGAAYVGEKASDVAESLKPHEKTAWEKTEDFVGEVGQSISDAATATGNYLSEAVSGDKTEEKKGSDE